MLIKYNIKLTNPIEEQLKATDDKNTNSSIQYKRTNKGLVFTGKLTNGKDEVVASNTFSLGNSYQITEKLKDSDLTSYYCDPQQILKLNNTNIKEIPKTLKNKIKTPSKIKNNLYRLETAIQYKDDVIFFELSMDGLLTIVSPEIEDYTNLVLYAGNKILIYFEVNPTLNIKTTNNYNCFFLPTNLIHTLPNGFCTISNNLVDNTKGLVKIDSMQYLYKTEKTTTFTSTFPFTVDGIKTYKLLTNKNENYLISNTTDLVFLNEVQLDLKDNITVLYLLQKDGSLEPYLMYCNKEVRQLLGLELLSGSLKVRKQTINSSIENKKRYVIQQYKVKLISKDLTLEINNEAFMAKLTADALQFNKKVIENDN